MKQTIEITVDIPEGYEFDRFDTAILNDQYLDVAGDASRWQKMVPSVHPVIILRKKQKRYRVFEETGEVRRPNVGDQFLDKDGRVTSALSDFRNERYPILREVTDQVTVTEHGSSDE